MRALVLIFSASMALPCTAHADDAAVPASAANDAPATTAHASTVAQPTRAQLLAALPGKRMSYTTDSGRVVQWVNNADGSAALNKSPRPGGKHSTGLSASAHWNVSGDGKFCMTEEWPLNHGGTTQWCRAVTLDANGTPSFVPDEQ